MKKNAPLDKNIIIYASDNNLIVQLTVSLYSLLETNYQNNLLIHLFLEDVSQEDKEYLRCLAAQFHTDIIIEDMPNLSEIGSVNIIPDKRSPIMYCRLFFEAILPHEYSKVLWLDSDTLVVGDISVLFALEISQYACIMAKDPCDICILAEHKRAPEPYFNSGIMLVNMNKWRDFHFLDQVLKEAQRRGGMKGPAGDQSYINCILRNHIATMPVEYNYMPKFFDGYRNYNLYHGLFFPKNCHIDEIYSQVELQYGYDHLKIIHYGGGSKERPWFSECIHPAKDLWFSTLKKTKFGDTFRPSSSHVGKDPYDNKIGIVIRRVAMKIPIISNIILRIRFGYWPKDISIPSD